MAKLHELNKAELQNQRKAIIDNYKRKIEELRNEKHQLQTEIEDFNFKGF